MKTHIAWLAALTVPWMSATAVVAETIVEAQPLSVVPAGDAAGGAFDPARMSDAGGSGRWVLFTSDAPDLMSSVIDDNGTQDVFLRDNQDGSLLLVSHRAGNPGRTANGTSTPRRMSADGRYVLFSSRATDLVEAMVDSADRFDVFLYDRISRTTTLVSHQTGSATTVANGNSQAADISADGRWVLYASGATNLVNGISDTNGRSDTFLFDRDAASTRLISTAGANPGQTGNHETLASGMSADGRWLLLATRATDLVAGISDLNGTSDVVLEDRDGGGRVLVSRAAAGSVTAAGYSLGVAISADGNRVLVYTEASNFMAGITDNNNAPDLFLYDRPSGNRILVSRRVGQNVTAPGISEFATRRRLSPDGRYVPFHSTASALFLTGNTVDGNSGMDAYLFDSQTGAVHLVSQVPGTAVSGNAPSRIVGISDDGRYSMLQSSATDLVAGVVDNNNGEDVFLFDRQSGTQTLLSGSGTSTAERSSSGADISGDGQRTLLVSQAGDLAGELVDANGEPDLFLTSASNNRSLLTRRALGWDGRTGNGRTEAIAISDDQRWVVLSSHATDLVPDVNDQNGAADLILLDRQQMQTHLVTRSAVNPEYTANGASTFAALSPSGRWLLYRSMATDLVTGVNDTNGADDVYLFDRLNGTNRLISHLAGQFLRTGSGDSVARAISDDGRWILFQSRSTHIDGGVLDGNGEEDVFVYDALLGEARMISRAAGSASAANGRSLSRALSADGRLVGFVSSATNLGSWIDTNASTDVFLKDLDSGELTLVSRVQSAQSTGNGIARFGDLSADGRWLSFESSASNLLPGIVDNNLNGDVFIYDRVEDSLALLTHAAQNTQVAANGSSRPVAISSDGRYVLIDSRATDLEAGISDANGEPDVYLHDRQSGQNTLVSRAANGVATGNGASFPRALSRDGNRVLYASVATDLLAGMNDQNEHTDVYLYDRRSAQQTLLSRSLGDPLRAAAGASEVYDFTADGLAALLWTDAADLRADLADGNRAADAFRVSGWTEPQEIFADGFE